MSAPSLERSSSSLPPSAIGHSPPPAAHESQHWLGSVGGFFRRELETHLFFWVMTAITLYVVFMVPQVANVWRQWPPLSPWFFAYGTFLLLLACLYLGSIVTVLQSPKPKAEKDAGRSIVKAAFAFVPEKAANFLIWVAKRLDRIPAKLAATSATSNAEYAERLGRISFWTRATFVAALLGAAGIAALIWGADSASSRAYPLSGTFCRKHGVLFLLISLWMIARPKSQSEEASTSWYVGRLLSWAFWTACAGEAIWFLASTQSVGWVVSYRVYTIWAVANFATFGILLGLLVDRLNELHPLIPVRALAAIGLVVLFGLATRPESISEDDAKNFARGELLDPATLAPVKHQPKGNSPDVWFDHLEQRLQTIPKDQGPAVIIAASGGGSRAAIFTSLVLETLARTPIDPNLDIDLAAGSLTKRRTWTDNAVMISSVSGGSLSTAYFVNQLTPMSDDPTRARPPEDKVTVANLRNTTLSELLSAMKDLSLAQTAGIYETQKKHHPQAVKAIAEIADIRDGDEPQAIASKLRGAFRKLALRRDQLWLKAREAIDARKDPPDDGGELDVLENVTATLHADLFVGSAVDPDNHELAPNDKQLLEWTLTSKAFDEMCLDFMAPLMQGAQSPTLGRGEALAFAWRDRFGWYHSNHLDGYAEPLPGKPGKFVLRGFAPYHPQVFFNACDANHGSRVVVGFPSIPNAFWKDDATATFARPISIHEHNDRLKISLPRAVRFSSNFPFGFRLADIPPQKEHAGDPPADGNAPSKNKRHLHLIDGGVVDNTGLDTFREVFLALNHHAKAPETNRGKQAKRVLELFRERGVVILEIDAGAKPAPRVANPFDPISGTSEQMNALTNAAYTNAELVKSMHVKDIRAVLNWLPPVSDKGKPSAESHPPQVPTTLHVKFQCNHYLLDEDAPPNDVMTAWSLGPRDKAQVAHRFLIELGQWDRRRRAACKDVRLGFEGKDLLKQTAQAEESATSITAMTKTKSFEKDPASLKSVDTSLGKALSIVKNANSPKAKELFSKLNTTKAKVADALQGKTSPNLEDEIRQAASEVSRFAEESRVLLLDVKDPQIRYDLSDFRQRAVYDMPAKAPVGAPSVKPPAKK